jgi:hypothetical protein
VNWNARWNSEKKWQLFWEPVWHSAEFLNVAAGGNHSYHCVLNGCRALASTYCNKFNWREGRKCEICWQSFNFSHKTELFTKSLVSAPSKKKHFLHYTLSWHTWIQSVILAYTHFNIIFPSALLHVFFFQVFRVKLCVHFSLLKEAHSKCQWYWHDNSQLDSECCII